MGNHNHFSVFKRNKPTPTSVDSTMENDIGFTPISFVNGNVIHHSSHSSSHSSLTSKIDGSQCLSSSRGRCVKEGMLYSAYRANIKPFDIVFFKGDSFISSLVAYMEKRFLPLTSMYDYRVNNDDYTHCGMVVTSEILDHPLVEKGKLYIWESTISGTRSPDGVPSITGKTFFGSQLRDLDTLIDAYDFPNDTSIAVAHLAYPSLDDCNAACMADLKRRFTMIFNKYDMVPYPRNPVDIAASTVKFFRPLRNWIHTRRNNSRGVGPESEEDDLEMICSELIARVFIELGILPQSVDPRNVVPMDFLGFDGDDITTGGLIRVVGQPRKIVSARHFFANVTPIAHDVISTDIDWFGSSGRIQLHTPEKTMDERMMDRMMDRRMVYSTGRWDWWKNTEPSHSTDSE